MVNNWEHKEMTIDELKELVRDVYDCKYLHHCNVIIML